MTALQQDRALGFLYLLLEKARYAEDPAFLQQVWAASTMAKFCGLITASSCNRIARWLDERNAELSCEVRGNA